MGYDVVLSDPPWSYYGQQDKWGAAAKFYDLVPDEHLVELARPPLNKPGILFLWTTSAKMQTAIALLDDWGLHYRGIAFVWIKTRLDGTPIGAQGVRPSITKPLTEFVIAGSNIVKGRPLPLADEGVPQTVLAPKRQHSRKPDTINQHIERMYPTATKLEMFARERRHGWDATGDQIDLFTATTRSTA